VRLIYLLFALPWPFVIVRRRTSLALAGHAPHALAVAHLDTIQKLPSP
jgi:hypothetical protein